MKMKTFHVLWILIFLSAGIGLSATDGSDIHGYIGKGVIITCSHSWASTNIKYFCRDPCKDTDILVKSDQSPTGRYTLKDSGAGTFTVSITDLQESDSGIYWCGVDRSVKDTYKKVRLTVSKDPSKSITTATQPYKDIQTSMNSHTTTIATHSESPSTTASLTSRYSSSDDITLSPSATASVNHTVYILYAVGGLLIAVIIFAAGLFTIHQHRKKVKTSASFTLPSESKVEQDDSVYENDAPKTNSAQMTPINRTRQVQKSQYSVYENSYELYGNL